MRPADPGRRPGAGARITPPAVAIIVIGCLAASIVTGDRLSVGGFTASGSPSAHARSRLARGLGYDPQPGMVILVRGAHGESFSPGPPASVLRASLRRLVDRVARTPAVGSVQSAFGPGGVSLLLARDHRSTLLLVHFRSTSQDAVDAPIARLRGHLRQSGLRLAFGGYMTAAADISATARSDLVRAELIAFPLLALLVVLMFRGALAAAVPMVIAATSVVATFAVLRLLSNVIGISIFALNLAVLLGLGLAVDYGLYLIARFREEAGSRGAGPAAVSATMATAGRAVRISGLAVAGACAGMLVFPEQFIYSMAIAGMLVAVLAALSALLLGPALLTRFGDRIAASDVTPPSARWGRWSRWVLRHRIDVSLITVCILVTAAGPALGSRFTFSDLTSVPEGLQTRTVADFVAQHFVPNLEYPVTVAVPLRGRDAAGPGVGALLAFAPGVAQASPVLSAGHDLALVQLVLDSPPLSPRAEALVHRLRTLTGVEVGGPTAEFVDLKASIIARAPLALLIAALATVVALLAVTRSLLIPAKALAFHALVLAAVFGLLVLIFQDHIPVIGWLLGYRGPPALETTVAVVIVASTYGLSTDYSILLLSRIAEEHHQGRCDEDAVSIGLQRTGPVLTSAAALLAVALLALASSRIFLVKQLVVGQVLGVLIDVSLVRLLLVPAFMGVLGRLNWFWPNGRGRREAGPAP